MVADGYPLSIICDIKVFEIPFFQRGYVWGTENWEDLFNELKNYKSSHFLGSIILKKVDNEDTSKPTKSIIIDGQQRLTTLTILLKAFYDTFSDDVKNNTIETILKYLFYKEKETSAEYKIKMIHSRYDAEDYKKVIGEVIYNGKEKDITHLTSEDLNLIEYDSDDDKTHRILKCYKFFYQKLSGLNEQERNDIFEGLISKKNQLLVAIHLGDNDKEQKIFDTINNAGVKLSDTDTIKNSLFDYLIQCNSKENKEDVCKLHDENWIEVFAKDEKAIEYWNTEKAQGRLKKSNSDILLTAYALIKKIYDPYKSEQNMEDIPDLYKKHFQKIINDCGDSKKAFKKLKAELEEIIAYAKIYREKIISFNKETMFDYKDVQIKVIKLLDMMEVTALTPYILYLYKKFGSDSKVLNKKFNELFQLVMIKLIAHESTANYNKSCKFMISDENYVIEHIKEHSDNKWAEGVSKMKNKEARIILFWLELYRRSKDKKISEKGLHDKYTLEHVMPVTWETNWSNIPVYDVEKKVIISNAEEARLYRRGKILSLGNMTLLSQEVNSAVNNLSFKKKKKDYKQYGDSITLTKNDIVTIYMDKNIQWDEKSIAKREKALQKELIQIFGIK